MPAAEVHPKIAGGRNTEVSHEYIVGWKQEFGCLVERPKPLTVKRQICYQLAKITSDLDKGKGVVMGSLNTVMKPWTAMKQGIINHLNNFQLNALTFLECTEYI